MMTLKPDEHVHKALLSTRSRLVGEYDDPDDPELFVTHAWQHGPEVYRNLVEGAYSQSFFVAVFRTEPVDQPSIALPEFSYFADLLASHLTILYGKHFQSHGLLETSGFFRAPVSLGLRPTRDFSAPYFSHTPRRCVPTPLNLAEISRIRPLLDASTDEVEAAQLVSTAGIFYSRALTEIEQQPDLAYLDLVTCGEILSSARSIPQNRLCDTQVRSILSRIEAELSDGTRVANLLRRRLFQVRRRFSEVLADFLDDYFFSHFESRELGALKVDTIKGALKAAYDLRSRYVHTGVHFGGWMNLPHQTETVLGTPLIEDKELKKVLCRAPTLHGLERVMRYALLKVASEAGARLDDLYQDQDPKPS